MKQNWRDMVHMTVISVVDIRLRITKSERVKSYHDNDFLFVMFWS